MREIESIKGVILSVGERKAGFTASDVRDALGFEPSNPNLIGAAFRALKQKGQIAEVADARSRTPGRNSGHVFVWRSCVAQTGVSSLTAWF
jgi:hypothetical protein